MIVKRREEEGKRVSFIHVFFVLRPSVLLCLVLFCSFTPCRVGRTKLLD